ncbi:MAG: protein kinase [Acidobacteriota bacterium]
MLASDIVLQNRYRIERLLGKGGMGAVYLAEDEQLGMKVALKETLFDAPVLRRAFEREARLLKHLSHPALPWVREYFTENGKQYLVMQYVDGEHLEQLVEERTCGGLGPFAVEKVLQWGYQLLNVLEYLHSHQPPVIHRDIKPLNLKLTPRGEVILLDFGLAKGAVGEMSQAASLLGYSPHYAPLEQMDGTGTDPRTDLYSLAATLYRLMTGQVPASAVSRAAATSRGEPDPLLPADKLNPQVPPAIAAVLARALAQNAGGRQATAKEMRGELREAMALRSGCDSISAGQKPQRNEAGTLADEEQEVVSPYSTSIECTYAGQPSTLSLPQGSDALNQIAPVKRPRLKITLVAGIALSILLTLGFISYGAKSSQEKERAEGPGSPAPTILPRVELLDFAVETKTVDGKPVPIVGERPIVVDEWFKLHFSSRQSGYLYIAAPNEKGIMATFLTAQANPVLGVKTNRIEAGAKFSFPPKPERWLRLTGSVETYLVIFTPAPLAEPLEPAEFQKWIGHVAAQTERNGDQFSVTTSASGANAAPVLFEIMLKRRDSSVR